MADARDDNTQRAPIADADRAIAERLLRDIWFECGKKPRDPSGGIEQVAQAIADARGEHDAEIQRLKDLIHRDKTGLALGLNKIQRITKGFDWICEGRGPYEYDDDRYRMEVGSLIAQVLAVAKEHLNASGELADEAFHPRAKETAQMLAEDRRHR